MPRTQLRFRLPRARNLEIYNDVVHRGRVQAEVGRKHGISQQRVAAIVNRVRYTLSIAAPEELDGVPFKARLQAVYREHEQGLKVLMSDVYVAWDRSQQPSTQLNTGEGPQGAWSERVAKTQHGSAGLANTLLRVKRELCETRSILAELPVVYVEDTFDAATIAAAEKKEDERDARIAKRKAEREAKGQMTNVEARTTKGEETFHVQASMTRGEGIANDELQMSKESQSTKGDEMTKEEENPNVQIPMTNAGTAATPLQPAIQDPHFAIPSAPESAIQKTHSEIASAPESQIQNPQSAIPPAKRRGPPISKLTGKPISAPRLQPAAFLRRHGLDPDDYGGGCDAPRPQSVSAYRPTQEEVLSRDVSKMTDAEFELHQTQIRMLKLFGLWVEGDHRPVIQCREFVYPRDLL